MVGEDVDLVFGLELICEVLDESIVDVTASEVVVVGGAEDLELALGEGDDRDGESGVADVDKGDMARVFGLRKVGLGDSVSESSGSGVVDEAEDVEVGDGSSIEEGASLDVGVPSRDGDHDVAHADLELSRSDVSQLSEIHADDLGIRELVGFVEVPDLDRRTTLIRRGYGHDGVSGTHLDTDGSININELRVDEFLFKLEDLLVVQSSSDAALKAADGVFEVGGFLRLGSLSDRANLGAKGDQGPRKIE